MTTRCTILLARRGVYLARYESTGGPWTRTEGMFVELDVPDGGVELTEAPQFAKTLAERIRGGMPEVDQCSLVVPAAWCLHQAVEIEHARLGEEPIEYAFEQYVPCSLEDLSCHITRGRDGSAIITAVPAAPMQRFLEELEDQGLSIDVLVTDASMLTPDKASDVAGSRCATVLITDSHTTLVAWDAAGEHMVSARTIRLPWPAAADAIEQQITATRGFDAAFDRITRVAHLTSSEPALSTAVVVPPDYPAERILHGSDAAHAIMDRAVRDDAARNLRTGRLSHARRWQAVQRHASRFLVAAAVTLAALGVKLHVETAAKAKAAAELDPIRTTIFHEVFPDQKATAAAAMQMASYRVKLEGLTAETGRGTGTAVEARVDPLVPLIRFVGHIPGDTKLFVDELTVDGPRLRVRGRTLAHEAAGDLVRVLNETGYWSVDPPRTKLRSDGTVEFRIQCEEADDD